MKSANMFLPRAFHSTVFFMTFIITFFPSAFSELVNITVQETSADVTFIGKESWTKNITGPLYNEGAQAVTHDSSSSAMLAFTGVAIYCFAPTYISDEDTYMYVQLDDGESMLVNLTDQTSPAGNVSESPKVSGTSRIMWHKMDLADAPHTVTISVGNIALFDAFIYTKNQSRDDDTSTSNNSSGPILRNITIEETAPEISYNGDWGQVSSNLFHGGFQAQATDINANATIKFTGIAVYYYASRWPLHATTVLRLDDEDDFTLDLTDHSIADGVMGQPTTNTSISWSRTNLSNTEHTLVVKAADYGFVDALIYTQTNATDSGAPSTSPSTSPMTSSMTSSPSGDHPNVSVIVWSSVGGGLALLALILGAIILRIRARNKQQNRSRLMFQRMFGSQSRHALVTPYTLIHPTETAGIQQRRNGIRKGAEFEQPSVAPPSYREL